MKLTIEKLAGENVETPSGRAAVWKGTTEEGFRCLVLVYDIVRPEGSPDEDFAELDFVPSEREIPVLSHGDIDRLASIAFPDGGITEPPPAQVVSELKAMTADKTADPMIRSEAFDLMVALGLGELSTQEFWRRVLVLRRKRDERPPR